MGDLIVHMNVKFPDSLDPSVLGPLESILPPRPELPTFPDNVHIDDQVEMQDASDRKMRNGAGPGGMDVDDDDEDGGHGPQVQCANQ